MSGLNMPVGKMSGSKMSIANMSWVKMSGGKMSGSMMSIANMSWCQDTPSLVADCKMSGSKISVASCLMSRCRVQTCLEPRCPVPKCRFRTVTIASVRLLHILSAFLTFWKCTKPVSVAVLASQQQ